MNNKSDGLRQDFYQRIDRHNLFPLWEQLHNLVPREPAGACVAALWRYKELRPYLSEAGRLISAQEAVRRVLVLENPALRGQASITSSLYAGLQLILPGEIAPSHRHSQSALRFVVEGRGAFTAVEGERATMEPGDFIITPSWAWHDHGNPSEAEGGEPVIWLDGLDIPLVRFFDAGFAENHEVAEQPILRPEGNSLARFGMNMLPVRHQVDSHTSPIFSYPYSRTREALDTLLRQEQIDPWDGVKLRYVNPATGGWPMPTIATFMQILPRGFRGQTYRSTDASVFSVVEGQGSVFIGAERFDFEPRDLFVVPSWAPVRFQCEQECVLFSFSDRPVQQALGILRESRETP
ncbi:gentisate 1,2-dioxygenase [Pseudomonas chlororaphis]|uniref:Gentisate 1,2-dioxygenase n=1 Tax=Pseudomonas chlororaphis TaxID=587753 RepID=A0AAX3FQN2_9PSED|nr:gentisate 1,2-dioxygenase [Pseudomonas chlororaphis]AZC37979.1 Gentisate 1,2-dioxygenase [Pseudomonas chlororaphis subsp. piscium]AZC44526.1 Gentisate 1,2-dioxygenase [Pseudomonas chlororaphis subsp. piscium]WDG70155.1 gentisate 1,2-dioxygenase [Pseudomonas chlororaphis]WDH32060.1 gentisate 1,2-dioxygenase [Pseudomonas chlororaphis]WDH68680.1 gentisate 1,2-dioxygenase [Pseudomonas chlororaphis]